MSSARAMKRTELQLTQHHEWPGKSLLDIALQLRIQSRSSRKYKWAEMMVLSTYQLLHDTVENWDEAWPEYKEADDAVKAFIVAVLKEVKLKQPEYFK